MERKPLIVYYSNENSQIGEIAHKLALDVKGDIYEVQTMKKLTFKELKKDGKKTYSKISIQYDSIDFRPYNEIFIGGEWVKKHLIGPMRQWIEQNKMSILRDDIKLIFFGYDHRGSNIHKAINEMVEILGEPYRRLIISPEDYPFHNLSRKIGYHQTNEMKENEHQKEERKEECHCVINKTPETHIIQKTPMEHKEMNEQKVRSE